MSAPRVGDREEWLAERTALLAREKDLNRLRDELAEERRRLPWVPVEKDYRFEGPDGPLGLADLFGGRSQLAVYHLMMGPGWEEGCPSCSFWADSFDGVGVHLAHRDVALVCVSRAPYAELAAYKERMGWTFPWFSSHGSDFNFDFDVSFTPSEQEEGATYNFRSIEHPPDEAPGLSVFALDDGTGEVFHTYSTYARGLDPINGGYQILDLVPKGRDEAGLAWPMEWLRRHDAYD